ncbi:MAG TPA: magnesium transporter [Gemmataceae bacterium]|nr:magnesium transporter [Gemmataceae bacterium]
MPHLLFGPEVRQLLQENDPGGMKAFCESLHPATVAEALTADFSVEEVWRFLETTNITNQAAIFEYFPLEMQVRLVEGTGRQRMATLIEKMSHDDRVALLRRLMPRVADQLLRLVDEADRRDIAQLVKYPQNTAGAIMTTDYAWLPDNLTAGEALDRLRLQAPDRETIYYVFVLSEDRKLLGVSSLRDLILAQRQALVKDTMNREPVTVRVTDDREIVAKEMARYDLLAIPVVDENGRLVGIVTHDDVMDVVVQEATEDVHRMGGVGPMAENYLQANFFTVWRKRTFWLACLFIAELFTFTALSYFDEEIGAVVVLALFVPLCISTGGNSGSQAATLITRALALGQVTQGQWRKVLRHELLMGVALGLTLGAIGFFRGLMTAENVRANITTQRDKFQIVVPKDLPKVDPQTAAERDWLLGPLVKRAEYTFSEGVRQVGTVEKQITVMLPEGHIAGVNENDSNHPNAIVYDFPEECKIRTSPVPRLALGIVIAQAVAAICLWGTLIGSMLPLLFKRIGVDPGIASSPFVATFVDVTGIVIYFSIAKIWLL